MRYIKKRTIVEIKTVPVVTEVDGELTQIGEAEIETKTPDGIGSDQSVFVCTCNRDLDFWMTPDDAEVPSEDIALPDDIPPLDEPGHPLHGMRVVPVVMAGMPDCVLDSDGLLVPAIQPEEATP